MDRTQTVQQFVMTLDYKQNTKSLHDHLYSLVDKLADTLGAGFKSLLTGFDNQCEPTPEITIERSKVASVSFLFQMIFWAKSTDMSPTKNNFYSSYSSCAMSQKQKCV